MFPKKSVVIKVYLQKLQRFHFDLSASMLSSIKNYVLKVINF